jgi:hypothetical protein
MVLWRRAGTLVAVYYTDPTTGQTQPFSGAMNAPQTCKAAESLTLGLL